MVVASLRDAQRFAGIKLTPQADRLLRSRGQKTGAKLVQLNRLLLESAFPLG